jgi:hypothetical protein
MNSHDNPSFDLPGAVEADIVGAVRLDECANRVVVRQ